LRGRAADVPSAVLLLLLLTASAWAASLVLATWRRHPPPPAAAAAPPRVRVIVAPLPPLPWLHSADPAAATTAVCCFQLHTSFKTARAHDLRGVSMVLGECVFKRAHALDASVVCLLMWFTFVIYVRYT
jgi:hypothetical protein